MIDWTIGEGSTKTAVQHAKSIVNKLTKVSPCIHHLRIVVVGAYEYPDTKGEFVHGEFCPPCSGSPTPVIFVCVYGTLEENLCHEYGHYEQYRDNKPIEEEPDIEQRTKRLMEAIKRKKRRK